MAEKFTGKGKYKYPGGTYSGDFVGGRRQGHGVMTFNNHDMYDGEWKDDKMEGIGKYRFHDGKFHFIATFEGKFMNSKPNGLGRLKYANGDTYFGHWVDGNRNGTGQLYSLTKRFISGTWKDDRLVEGMCLEPDGSRYVGAFAGDVYSGSGVLFLTDGTIQQGTWQDGALTDGVVYRTDGKMDFIRNKEVFTEETWMEK